MMRCSQKNAHPFVTCFKDYLKRNYLLNESVSEIASKLKISESHLSTMILKYTKKKAGEHVKEYRWEKLKVELIDQEGCLNELAEKYNFPSKKMLLHFVIFSTGKTYSDLMKQKNSISLNSHNQPILLKFNLEHMKSMSREAYEWLLEIDEKIDHLFTLEQRKELMPHPRRFEDRIRKELKAGVNTIIDRRVMYQIDDLNNYFNMNMKQIATHFNVGYNHLLLFYKKRKKVTETITQYPENLLLTLPVPNSLKK